MATVNVEAEKAAIRSVLDGYVTSIEKADIDLYARVVANDPDMVNFGSCTSERIVGWDALKAVIEAQNAALSDTHIAVSDVTIHLLSGGQYAWATSMWDLKATMAGQAVKLPLRCTWVLEKRGLGWVIIHFHKSEGTPG